MSQASSGHKEVVRILLESNAVWDQSDRHGTTPLLMACAQGHEANSEDHCNSGIIGI